MKYFLIFSLVMLVFVSQSSLAQMIPFSFWGNNTGSTGLHSQQGKFQSSDIQAADYFGRSVAISDDGATAVVGAYLEDTGGGEAGSAYIFTRSGVTWSQQAKIQSSDIQGVDYFAESVSLSTDGSYAIVGARFEDTTAGDSESTYVFKR